MTRADSQSNSLSSPETRLTRVRGVPLAGPALSLGDLFGGYLGGKDVAVLHQHVSPLTGQP